MAKVRVTQAFLDVVTQDDSTARVSQAMLEVLGVGPSVARVSQAMAEALYVMVGPDMPTVTVSNIAETTADFTGSAFVQGQGASATHSASRWIARNANTGAVVYDSGETATDLTTHTVPEDGLPSYTDLFASAMYKNGSGEWSYYPGPPSATFQTLVEAAEAVVALQFYDASMTLLSTHVPSAGHTASSYADFLTSEEVTIPANTRYIVPGTYKLGSGLANVYTKEVKLDVGRLASAYEPTSFKPEIHNETDINPALTDLGQVTADFDIDWSLGNAAMVELAGNLTMSWSNMQTGGRYYLIVEQDTTGSRLLTWPAGVAKFASGTAPTLTTTGGSKDVFVIIAESASIAHVSTMTLDSK